MPDKWGCHGSPIDKKSICVPECRYYEEWDTIEDDEVLSWYRKEIGSRTYTQLKHENDIFIREFVEYLRKQANELPVNANFRDYYPSIEDIT